MASNTALDVMFLIGRIKAARARLAANAVAVMDTEAFCFGPEDEIPPDFSDWDYKPPEETSIVDDEEHDLPLREPIRIPPDGGRREWRHLGTRKDNSGQKELYKETRRGMGRATENFMIF